MQTLNTVRLAITDIWGDALPQDIYAVVQYARESSLGGVPLPIDNVPSCVEVCGAPWQAVPMVLANDFPDKRALMLLPVQGRLWARLAYQFGHELGHIVANYGAVSPFPDRRVTG